MAAPSPSSLPRSRSPSPVHQHPTQMQGKVCIVTGASSGIGETIALMFAKRGAFVTLCGRNEERLQAALEKCTVVSGGQAHRFLKVSGDVVETTVRKDIVQKTEQIFKRVDVLVANAGMFPINCKIDTATHKRFKQAMDVNTKSVFFLIKEALPHLEKTKGNVIVISSATTSMSSTPNVVYEMTKAAIDHMVRSLAVNLGPKNIRVNAVNPSYIPTLLARDAYPSEAEAMIQATDMGKIEVKKHPLGNKLVTKEAVSEAVSFLASDAAQFITGLCMRVDGGRAFMGKHTKPLKHHPDRPRLMGASDQ